VAEDHGLRKGRLAASVPQDRERIMNSPYAPPASDIGSGSQTSPGKVAKGFTLFAGLSAFAAAIYFVPMLARFRAMSTDLGASLDPLMEGLTIGGGAFPAVILGGAGIFAIASFFTRRRGLMLTAIVACFLLSTAAVVLIPLAMYSALSKEIKDLGTP
jgi:hypothetical protein